MQSIAECSRRAQTAASNHNYQCYMIMTWWWIVPLILFKWYVNFRTILIGSSYFRIWYISILQQFIMHMMWLLWSLQDSGHRQCIIYETQELECQVHIWYSKKQDREQRNACTRCEDTYDRGFFVLVGLQPRGRSHITLFTMSILHSSVVHLTDLVSLREALLDARRDTVTHRATIEDPEARA